MTGEHAMGRGKTHSAVFFALAYTTIKVLVVYSTDGLVEAAEEKWLLQSRREAKVFFSCQHNLGGCLWRRKKGTEIFLRARSEVKVLSER